MRKRARNVSRVNLSFIPRIARAGERQVRPRSWVLAGFQSAVAGFEINRTHATVRLRGCPLVLDKRHGSVNHSIGEYVRGDIHTNTAEGYFSIMKRGIYGTFHHISQQHLSC